ncbi:hypothetical protein PIB30_056822 [Stylosanthes scabra]|uniref:NAB domain-containing protein n=1 Tax=Stylosanthes scabra TaxID=79078 RepID=A0ABU6VIF8_9FABA|nr:hypothetical protein [Stylosanthes scabra]
MASGAHINKQMKRLESRKSHSWWWDSHISPKNSKWLSENLEEMDRNVKQMLKLIEQDADSFAKKAEMYYQKRPELVALVEKFYRGYRSLAERYDHVTVELQKNIPSDLQSQGSGISDSGSEPSSTWPSPMKGSRRKSKNRAAGFEYFLGSGGNGSDSYQKDVDDSSTMTDSEEESDDSSVNNYSSFNGSDPGMSRRISELESELREVREKLWIQEEEHVEGSSRGLRNENIEDAYSKINAYEQELLTLNEKLRLSEEEITKLKIELGKHTSLDSENLEAGVELSSTEKYTKTGGEGIKEEEVQGSFEGLNKDSFESNSEIESLGKELRITNGKLEEKIFPEKAQMKAEMSKVLEESAHIKEQIREWESRGRAFEDDIRRIQTEKLENEEALKGEIELLKADIEEREKNIKDLNATIDALKAERDNLNVEVCSLKEEVKSRDDRIEQMNNHLNQLHMEHVQLIAGMEEAHRQVEELKSKAKQLEDEVERQRTVILEGAEEKREAIRQLCFSLEHYRNGYNMLKKHFVGHKRVPILAS